MTPADLSLLYKKLGIDPRPNTKRTMVADGLVDGGLAGFL